MTRRPNGIDSLIRLAVCLALAWSGVAFGQNVILHLRNGDRIAGVIIAEDTNNVTIATSWAPSLKVPVAQIESREPAPAEAMEARATPTQKPAPVLAGSNSPPPFTPWFKRWKGEATVGSDFVQGATDHELYYGKLSLTYAQPYLVDPKEFFRNIFIYSAEYGKTDGVLSANDMNGSSKTDFDVNRRIYVYNLGGAGYDEIRKINLQYEEGPGAGWHLLTQSNLVLNTELGANYQVQDRADNTRTEDFYYRLAEDVNWRINRQMRLTEKLEFFPQADDLRQYRMRFESNLSVGLLLNLALNLTVIDLYDTEPAFGVPPNELQFRTSLGVKF